MTVAPVQLRDRLTLDRVSFAHDGNTPGVLRDVSLTLPAGSVTAIVGPSGAGKSTLADLISGLQTPQQGRIAVDGVSLAGDAIRAWRVRVGYVDQDTVLFHDTVRGNLLWANPRATEAELHDALRLAAADFVFDLPRGLDTPIGDRGVRLSGGERQRLALARALLREPQLLLLDEATSALDAENETRILDAIDALRGRLTVLIITHRLMAVRRCDTIHVLEDGRLVESGDWDTLMCQTSGRFRSLVDAHGGEGPGRAPAALRSVVGAVPLHGF